MATTIRSTSGQTWAGHTDLETTICTCGVLFALPERMLRQRREDGKAFYCPHGHSLVFNGGRTALEIERNRLKRAEDEQARLRARVDQEHAGRIAQKAAAKRARNERDRLRARVAEGICPCCNREFKGLKSHMRQKHPDWVAEHGASAFAKARSDA